MCLKQTFFNSNWTLQAILYLTVLSNCISGNSNWDTAFIVGCDFLFLDTFTLENYIEITF